MGGRSSRDKGARGEREACELLSACTGLEWQRSLVQTRGGGTEAPDVVPVDAPDWDRVHIEVKRQKAVDKRAAMRQACHDAGLDGIPILLYREDRREWRAVIRLCDLLALADWAEEREEAMSADAGCDVRAVPLLQFLAVALRGA